jgi:regulator of replication initiation timing
MRFDKAQEAIEDVGKERDQVIKENSLKSAQIEFLQGELGKLKQKYDCSINEIADLKAENGKLSESIAEGQLKLKNSIEQVAKLKDNNDNLSFSLKESR